MTLIITELSPFGIAMAADTAVTGSCVNERGTLDDRAFFGLTKLIPIKKLEAGIAYWGWAKMPPDSISGVWMDWWLTNYLAKNHNKYNTIGELATRLEQELRKIIPRVSLDDIKNGSNNIGGIHIAGFEDAEGKKSPCFWHVHNGPSQALPNKKLDPFIVNANYDCPPEKYLSYSGGALYSTTNGDIEAFARFSRKHFDEYLKELEKEMGIVVPIPTLSFRAEFLRVQIRFISELYAIGGIKEGGYIKEMVKGIGGKVTTLTITENGIKDYSTR
jgi:hypothetical protein